MQQILHILKKDSRALGLDVAMMLATTAGFAFLSLDNVLQFEYFGVLIVLEAIYLTAKVVLLEPLTGSDAFWLTRPYRWNSLLAAKLLFVALWIHLPMFVARAVILSGAGFSFADTLPGLLWSQLTMFLCVSLPVAAFAAMSTNLMPVAGLLITVAIILVSIPFAPMALRFLPATRGTDLDWIAYALIAVTAAIVGSSALLLQYKTRRTTASRILVGVLFAVGVIGFTSIPFDVAWSTALLTGNRIEANEYDLLLSQHPHRPPRRTPASWRQDGKPHVQFFFRFQSARPGEEIRTHRLRVSLWNGNTLLQNADLIPIRGGGGLRGTVSANLALASNDVLLENRSITLSGSVYFSVFSEQPEPILITDQENIDVGNGVNCGIRSSSLWSSHTYLVRCLAPLRDPALIVAVDDAVLFQPSYSPFPADLSVHPLHVEEQFLSNYRPTDVRYLNVKRLAGHARKDFRFEGVQLADYLWP